MKPNEIDKNLRKIVGRSGRNQHVSNTLTLAARKIKTSATPLIAEVMQPRYLTCTKHKQIIICFIILGSFSVYRNHACIFIAAEESKWNGSKSISKLCKNPSKLFPFSSAGFNLIYIFRLRLHLVVYLNSTRGWNHRVTLLMKKMIQCLGIILKYFEPSYNIRWVGQTCKFSICICIQISLHSNWIVIKSIQAIRMVSPSMRLLSHSVA